MDKREENFKILEISQALRKYYHDALWEEEKHFTWWVSIVFPSLVLIYSSSQLCASQKVALITIGSFFGIFLAYIGFNVVKKEGIYFKESLETFNRTSMALELHMQGESQTHPLMPEYSLNESFEDAKGSANKPFGQLLLSLFNPMKLGVRDCFQLVFVFSGFLFFIIWLFTLLTLQSLL